MRVTIDATAYEASHGHRPRGFGNWTFGEVGGDRWFRWTGRLSDAKTELRRRVREQGLPTAWEVKP